METPHFPTLDGAGPDPLLWDFSRELSEADWLAPRGAKAPGLKALRASHHNLAKLLSEGHSDADVSLMTGYCPSRISILKADPAFKELLAHYRDRADELSVSAHGRIQALTIDTLETLHERLRESPEDISTNDLRQMAEMGLDRIGLPKATKTLNLNATITPEEISALRQSLEAGSGSPVISRSEFLRQSVAGAGSEAQEVDRGPADGGALQSGPGDRSGQVIVLRPEERERVREEGPSHLDPPDAGEDGA